MSLYRRSNGTVGHYKKVAEMSPEYHEHCKKIWRESKRRKYVARPRTGAIAKPTTNGEQTP